MGLIIEKDCKQAHGGNEAISFGFLMLRDEFILSSCVYPQVKILISGLLKSLLSPDSKGF